MDAIKKLNSISNDLYNIYIFIYINIYPDKQLFHAVIILIGGPTIEISIKSEHRYIYIALAYINALHEMKIQGRPYRLKSLQRKHPAHA